MISFLRPVMRLRRCKLERLKWSVRHAYNNVAHYKTAFDRVGVHPDDIQSLSDLSRLPFVEKARSA